jgi:hypothetical protein
MVQTELWQAAIRDVGGDSLVTVIEEIRGGQREIIKTLEHMEQRHNASEAAIEKITKAFPAGDLDGHRRYHETMIEMVAERRRLRIAIQEKTISGLVWAGLVGAAVMVWHELQRPFGH